MCVTRNIYSESVSSLRLVLVGGEKLFRSRREDDEGCHPHISTIIDRVSFSVHHRIIHSIKLLEWSGVSFPFSVRSCTTSSEETTMPWRMESVVEEDNTRTT